jgi:hypothetical protein
MSELYGTPEWITESGFWAFTNEIYETSWALTSFWLLVGILLAVWISAFITHKGKVGRLVAGGGMSALVVATWASVVYSIMDGLIWPYVAVAVIIAVLTIKLGKIGFILGCVIFFFFSLSVFVAPSYWIWAQSF